jgi:hypothetical protein
MQIGYYSWRSLIRQQLLYFVEHDHRPKQGGRFLFDKILHNEHELSDRFLQRGSDHYVLALRAPAETIPSVINLYRGVDAGHACATESGAIDYYIGRLAGLQSASDRLRGRFAYFDAACLSKRTPDALAFLSAYFGLSSALSDKYDMKPLTGAKTRGDPSPAMKLGKIAAARTSFAKVEDTARLAEAERRYSEVREALIANSSMKLLLPG